MFYTLTQSARHLGRLQLITFSLALALSSYLSTAQNAICDTNTQAGENLIINGGFEDGDTNFTLPGYLSWNASGNQPWSKPNQYWVHNDAHDFNKSFGGHPQTGTKFLMVDGECENNDIVWEQYLEVKANTRYFFSTGICSIRLGSPAELTFQINGENLSQPIQAPADTGVWVNFVDSSWISPVTGIVPIRIVNLQTNGCNSGNDFGLDNVNFAAGCLFGSPGETPNLGEDLDLCGINAPINLSTTVDGGSNIYTYNWSTGDTTETVDITEPGTYALCMSTNGSCEKSDVIVISESVSLNLAGYSEAICPKEPLTISANIAGGVTPTSYEWYINDSLITHSGNSYTSSFVENATIKVIANLPENTCGGDNTLIDSVEVVINSPEIPTTSLTSSNDTICAHAGVSFLLDASLPAKINQFEWYIDTESQNALSSDFTTTLDSTSWIFTKTTYSNLICTSDTVLHDSVQVVVNSPEIPTTSLTASNDTICANTEVSLSIDASPPNRLDQFEWYIDTDLQIDTTTDLTTTLGTSSWIFVNTSYRNLVCTSDIEIRDSVQVIVKATEIPTSTLMFSSDTICANTNVSLSLNATLPLRVNQYQWYIDTVLQVDTTTDFNATLDTSSWIFVNTSFGNLTCASDTVLRDSIRIEVVALQSPSITIDVLNNNLCEGNNEMTFFITDTHNPGDTPIYQWFLNGNLIENEQLDTLRLLVQKEDTITASLNSSLSCINQPVNSNPIVATIFALNELTLSLTPSKPTYCRGESALLTASTNSTGEYIWYINGELSNNSDSILIGDGYVNDDSISVIFISDDQCLLQAADTANITLTVKEVDFNLVELNSGAWCDGKDEGFEANNITNGGTSPHFSWFVNGVLQNNSSNTYSSQSWDEGDQVMVIMTSSLVECPLRDTATAIIEKVNTPKEIGLLAKDTSWCSSSEFLYSYYSAPLSTSEVHWTLDGAPIELTSNPFLYDENLIGSYSLIGTISDTSYCIKDSFVSDTAKISFIQTPIAEAGPNQVVLASSEIELDGSGSTENDVTYLWTPVGDIPVEILNSNELATSVTIEHEIDPTDFFLTDSKSLELHLTSTPTMTEISIQIKVTNGVCSSVDTTVILLDYNVFGVFPNAFSPNGDGDNDVFEIDYLDFFPDFKLEIYNRWGSLIYTQTEPNSFWDGQKEGIDMPVATYYYIFNPGNEGNELKGSLSLMR